MEHPASFHHSGIPRNCITPLVVTHPGLEAYPGIASGTAFFAKRGKDVFLFTALHCIESVKPPISFLRTAKQLTLPYRIVGTTSKSMDCVRFDFATRLAENGSLSDILDVVALHVQPEKQSNHQHLRARAAKLPPSGIWLNEFADLEHVQAAMDLGRPITFVIVGYPNCGTSTSVRYDDCNAPAITTQAAQFTGHLRRSPLDHCMKLENSSWPHDHAGFSGSPVFVHWNSTHGKLSALAGMAICGASGQLHFIDVATLVRATNEARASLGCVPQTSELQGHVLHCNI